MDAKHCAHCGASFTPRNSAQRYCAPACRKANQARRRKVPLADRACEQCGATYTPIRTNQRYCSRPCARRASYLRGCPKAEPTTATCEYCGQGFEYVRKGRPRQYCSLACRRANKHARSGRRRRQEGPGAERGPGPQLTSSFPRGSLIGAGLKAASWGPETDCAVCGRPGGEEVIHWRVHRFRTSPRGDETSVWICPRHFGTDPRLIDAILKASTQSWKGKSEGDPWQ